MSKKSSRKVGQAPKSKEQIAQDIKTAQESARLRALTRDKIWKILENASSSIADASLFVQSLKVTTQRAFQTQMIEQKLSDLKINEKVDAKAHQANYAMEFMDLMANETVATTVVLLDGIDNEINRLLRKEQSERPFTSLKTDFIPDEKETTNKAEK